MDEQTLNYEVIKNDDVIPTLLKDFSGIDITFVEDNNGLGYYRFKSVEDLQKEIFNYIEAKELRIAMIPLLGTVTWESKQITGNSVLFIETSSIDQNKKFRFWGVAK